MANQEEQHIDIDQELAMAEKEMQDADEQLRVLHSRYKEDADKRKPKRGRIAS